MDSVFAEYIREKSNDYLIEKEYGFATYRFINEGKSVYIVDIYIRPKDRKLGLASGLADQIISQAKAQGCTEAIGSVVPSSKGSTLSLKVLLAYGMSLQSSGQDFIFLRKDI